MSSFSSDYSHTLITCFCCELTTCLNSSLTWITAAPHLRAAQRAVLHFHCSGFVIKQLTSISQDNIARFHFIVKVSFYHSQILCFHFRLALYVYEYLRHVGAPKAAQTFLSEVSFICLCLQFFTVCLHVCDFPRFIVNCGLC